MQAHDSVSDLAIGRALGNLPYCDGDQAEESNSSTGPLQQRDLEMVTNVSNHHRIDKDDSDDIAGGGTHNELSSTYNNFNSPQTEWGGQRQKIHNEKLRKLPPTITNAYDNWTCDNESVSSINRDNESNSNGNDGGDEIAWKIIKGILSGWCAIWVLFAFIIIAAEVTSPKTPHRSNVYTLMVTEQDEQSFLEISEKIVSKCAYSKLETETGREECQTLCHAHMCCFNDEDNYGCSDKPEKMCAAYAGCESLIVSEDDAIIYNEDGVDVFGIGESDSDPLVSVEGDEQSKKNEQVAYEASELQLISEVITTVCSTSNLGTKHGLNECASLCNDGICCFDREQIELLNPNVDLILELEGITSEKLDTSAMGTCMDEGKHKEHFCQVHASCKNMLLLGSHYSGTDLLSTGGGDSSSGGNYIVFGILFGMIAMLTVYMLVFQRAGPIHVDGSRVRRELDAAREATTTRDEMIEFV